MVRPQGDHFRCAGSFAQSDRAQPDGARAEDGDVATRTETTSPREDPVVGDAGRLYQSTRLVTLVLVTVAVADRVQFPAQLGRHGDVFGKRTVDRETDLFQVQTLVGITITAGTAMAAPHHLLGGNHIAGHQTFDGTTDFDDLAGELVPSARREFDQAGIEDVVVFVSFVEVHVGATDTAGFDLDEDFVRLDARHRNVGDLQRRVMVDLVAGDRLAGSLLEF